MSVFREDDKDKIEKYPYLDKYTSMLKNMERPLVGRDKEIEKLLAAMRRPELCNVILLAPAGSGKTALVQGTKIYDSARAYLEVDLPKMISDLQSGNENEMANKLKQLFHEVEEYVKEYGREVVLFIDEFHQIVQLSSAAVEVLKPLLADSGTRGIRVIAATTYIEYQDYISSNQPLVERFQRINLSEPNRETVVAILRGMAQRYDVMDQFPDDSMFEAIYEYTNRYVPANAQPRKSILMLDSMIGWHRYDGRPIDFKLIADVIYDTEGINIAFRVDATTIKERLDKAVLAQEWASFVIENRLQICCAGLNNKDKPMSSFLFTGSTGVGKGLLDSEIIPVYDESGEVFHKRNGELVVGDFVFNRFGKPVKVTGVFPRGYQYIYEVCFEDGRTLKTDGSHLWTYRDVITGNIYTKSTEELFEKKILFFSDQNGSSPIYQIPMNQAVSYPEASLQIHPYVFGVLAATGGFLDSVTDGDVRERVFSLTDAFDDCSDLYAMFSECAYPQDGPIIAHIPDQYMYSSIEQRWDFIRGLFDISGSVDVSGNVHFYSSSEFFVHQLQKLLYSLGVSSRIVMLGNEYDLAIRTNYNNRRNFFLSKKKLTMLNGSFDGEFDKYGWLGITAVKRLDIQEKTTCIYVDDEEHLYQAGQYIVTHNTEMTKQLAKILFDNDRSLIRMDMTEYALDDSLNRFREELTSSVWARPYSIILLDEIEKACPPVTRLLLQVLDDGRLVDRNNREITFKNAYIIMTTNAGSEVYKTIAQYNADDAGSGAFVDKYDKLIRESIQSTTGANAFPPELLGRIDCIVPFQPLSERTMLRICHNKLNTLCAAISQKYNIDVVMSSDVLDFIVREKMTTDSDAGGARAVMSNIERYITSNLSRFINHIDKSQMVNRRIYVYVEGEMAVNHKEMLESQARIVVSYTPKNAQ